MAWTFRASGAQSSGNNASSLANIGLPAGWQAGDLHILHFQNYGGTNSRTPPATLSGWSDPTTWQNGTTSHAVYWRVAQAGDSAPTLSLSGTGATGDTQLARIHGFYPRAGATITRNQLGTNSTNASADDVGPISGITPTAADLVILTCGKSNDWNGTATLSGWTLATQSESTTGNDAGMALLYQLSSNGAATGNLTVTDNGGTASNGVGLGKLISFTETLVKTAGVSGGMTAAGAATTSYTSGPITKSFTGSGGMTAAGAGTTSYVSGLNTYTYSASGGVTAGGAGTTAYAERPDRTYIYVAGRPQALTILGPSAVPFQYNRELENWIVLSGSATTSYVEVEGVSYPYTASGGITASGAAVTSRLSVYSYVGCTEYLQLTALYPSGLPGARNVDGPGCINLSGTASTSFASLYAYSASGGVTVSGSGETSRLVVWTFSALPSGAYVSGDGVWSLTKAYTATGAVTAAGSALTAYQGFGTTVYTYAASGGVETGGASSTSYQAGGSEYVPPVYGGIFSRPSKKDQQNIKRWLEKQIARTFRYKGAGKVSLGGRAYARFVKVIESPKLTPFTVGEGVKRPILSLKTPKKPRKAQPDKRVIIARKAEALRLAKRKVEEEMLLLDLI